MENKIVPGWAFLPVKAKNKVPFTEFREIRKGKNKGKIEITVPSRKSYKVKVSTSAITRWPIHIQEDKKE